MFAQIINTFVICKLCSKTVEGLGATITLMYRRVLSLYSNSEINDDGKPSEDPRPAGR